MVQRANNFYFQLFGMVAFKPFATMHIAWQWKWSDSDTFIWQYFVFDNFIYNFSAFNNYAEFMVHTHKTWFCPQAMSGIFARGGGGGWQCGGDGWCNHTLTDTHTHTHTHTYIETILANGGWYLVVKFWRWLTLKMWKANFCTCVYVCTKDYTLTIKSYSLS